MMTPEEFYNKHYQYPQSEVEQITRESAIHFADAYRKHILASDGVSADVRRRFAAGDFVRVHLRNLDGKYWEGTVIKDTGEKTVKVISGKFIEAKEVERERIEFAP